MRTAAFGFFFWLSVALFTTGSAKAFSQSPGPVRDYAPNAPLIQVHNYSEDDNFPYLYNTTDLLQDREGMIWLSTWTGLVGFNGEHFESFVPYEQLGGQADSRINRLIELKNGGLLCLARGNMIYLFSPHERRFYDLLAIQGITQNAPTSLTAFSLPKGVSYIVCQGEYIVRNQDSMWLVPHSCSYFDIPDWKRVYNIYQDADGDEWVLTDRGVYIYGEKPFDDHTCYPFISETKDGMYLGTQYGLLTFYSFADRQTHTVHNPFPRDRFTSMSLLSDSTTLAISTEKGVLLLDVNHNEFRTLFENTSVYSVYEDSRHDLWLSTPNDNVCHYDAISKEETILSVEDSPYQKKFRSRNNFFLTEASDGNIWIVFRGKGICYYDRKNNCLKHYYADVSRPESVLSIPSRRSLIDRQGSLWMASDQQLNRIDFIRQHATLFETTPDELDTRCLYSDSKGHVWAFTQNGTVRILSKEGTTLAYLAPDGRLQKEPVCWGNTVYSMFEDENGNFWLGGRKQGLYILRPCGTAGFDDSLPSHFTISHYSKTSPQSHYSLSGDEIFSLFEDRDRNKYIAVRGHNGLNIAHKGERPGSTLKFINSKNRLSNWPDTIVNDRIRCFAQDSSGNIIIGTESGLICCSSQYSSQKGNAENIRFFYHHSFVDNDIVYLYTDAQQNLYILSHNGDVYRLTGGNLASNNATFSRIHDEHRKYDEQACSMFKDKEGALWVVFNSSIRKVLSDPIQGTTYVMQSVFPERLLFSEATILPMENGQIWLGTDRGILAFDPCNVVPDSYEPPIRFDRIRINGTREHIRIDNNEIIIRPDQRCFSIGFSALDYQHPNMILCSYRMDGLENTWQTVRNHYVASYVNIPKGNYTFRVFSTDWQGTWLNNENSITIRVLPTFWESAWGILTYILIFLLLCLIGIRTLYSFIRMRQRMAMERQINAIRISSLADMSRELKQPATLIAQKSHEMLLLKGLDDAVTKKCSIIEKNSQQLLGVLNQVLDFSQLQKDRTTLLVESFDLCPSVRKIAEHFQTIAAENGIRFSLDIPQTELQVWADRDKVEKIIFHLITNAFRHTPSGRSITFSVSTGEHTFEMTVSDEGPGISLHRQQNLFRDVDSLMQKGILFNASSNIGLSLVKYLMDMLHGTIQMESQPGRGTSFHLSFPSEREVYEQDAHAIILDKELAIDNHGHTPEDAVDPEFMKAATDFVEKNLSNTDISIDDMASALCVSRSVLYRRIKAGTGMSPVNFIGRIRTMQAAKLIHEGKMSLAEISDCCGFGSQAYFSSSFKKQYGLTPSQFKEKSEEIKTDI